VPRTKGKEKKAEANGSKWEADMDDREKECLSFTSQRASSTKKGRERVNALGSSSEKNQKHRKERKASECPIKRGGKLLFTTTLRKKVLTPGKGEGGRKTAPRENRKLVTGKKKESTAARQRKRGSLATSTYLSKGNI